MIKTYTFREGITTHLDVPEYGCLLRAYPDKDKEISTALEMIYLARTNAHIMDVDIFIGKAAMKAREAGLSLIDFGLSREELLEIYLVGSSVTLELYKDVRNALLSRGLMVFSDSHVNFLLQCVENKIEFMNGKIDDIYLCL